MLQFECVPLNKLSSVRQRLTELLTALVTGKTPIDLPRLVTVINRHRLECLSHLENSPHDSIAFMAIGDMLYGSTKKDVSTNTQHTLQVLLL